MRVINPANGQTVHELADDDAATVRARVASAREAQGAWAARPFEERAAIIARFAQLVQEQLEPLSLTTSLETGKPVAQAKNEINALGGRIAFFLERTGAELEAEPVLDDGGVVERIAHEPLGVIANVSAWNYPYFVGANVYVPALLTGNAVVYKPSEFATLTGRAVARALHAAGVPEQVFQVVTGEGAAGAALVESAVDGVFFTGSYATGKRIAQATAARMLRVQLELGGKDPAYVADDADVAKAAAGTADGAFYNAGQSCCAVERVYVHAAVWDEFVAAFVREVQGFVVGDPADPATYLGPLTRRDAAIATLEAQVADALGRGARVLTGGQRRPGPGFWFEPTVLVDVTHDMAVMRDESFGPIIGLCRVAGDDEARALMADTEYGLTAAMYSRDRARAERVLGALDVGTAYWNCCDRVSPRLPWSGRKHSGLGSTLSTYGIEAFLRPKAWHLRSP